MLGNAWLAPWATDARLCSGCSGRVIEAVVEGQSLYLELHYQLRSSGSAFALGDRE